MSGTSTAPSECVGEDDAMHLLFREHRRITSKDSNGSYMLRRRIPPSRLDSPETRGATDSAGLGLC